MGTTAAQYFTGLSTFSSDFQSIIQRAASIQKIPISVLQAKQADNLNQKQALVAINPEVASLGAAVGALGTLSANLVGGLLMGFAMELVTRHAAFTPEVRLLVTTGFLGGLTTFSTFSAEIVTLLMRKEYLWGVIAMASHLVGSLAMTFAGILLVRAIYSWGAVA